jgi:hypothetical protein
MEVSRVAGRDHPYLSEPSPEIKSHGQTQAKTTADQYTYKELLCKDLNQDCHFSQTFVKVR